MIKENITKTTFKKQKVEDLSLLTSVIKGGKTWKEHEYDMAKVYFDLVNEGK